MTEQKKGGEKDRKREQKARASKDKLDRGVRTKMNSTDCLLVPADCHGIELFRLAYTPEHHSSYSNDTNMEIKFSLPECSWTNVSTFRQFGIVGFVGFTV